MEDLEIRAPVGLPGEHIYIIFMVWDSGEERVVMMEGTSSPNPGAGRRGILTSPMSFVCADTEYMPYVGGQTSILSTEGMQKQRSRASIASSLPTPTKRFAGVRGVEEWICVLRREQRCCLSTGWWGSGYRCRPRKSIVESAVERAEGREGPNAFSLASRRMLVPLSL